MARQATDPGVAVADRQLHWAYRLPPLWRDLALLARLDRPIGTWLLLLPCWWGLALAPEWPSPWSMLLFAVGALAMRGAGCTINDMADRELDARVERTRNRPLAAGRVSMRTAMLLLAAQLGLGLLVLLQFDRLTVLIGLLAIPIVVVYPFMKRITHWPQAVLGLAFNWGALVGFTAATGGLGPEAMLLYLAGIAWTLGYDTIYAHQDKEDDAIVGVKSTALLFGARTHVWLWGFFGAMMVLLFAAGIVAGKGPLFLLGLALVAVLLARQVRTLRIDDPDDCLAKFRAHRLVGLAVLGSLLLGNFGS
jgi:4-hydroxybenzoate polyprenyltransferase